MGTCTPQCRKETQKLMDKIRELNRKLSAFIPLETNFQKETKECERLQKRVKQQDLTIDSLTRQLSEVKAAFHDEEEKRRNEKTALEDRIFGLEKRCQEFHNKYTVERTIREKNENDALLQRTELFRNKDKECESLNHLVQELTGYKTYAVKTIAEQRERLRVAEVKQAELETKASNKKLKQVNEVLTHQVKSLQGSLQTFQQKCQGLEETLEKKNKEIEACTKENHELIQKAEACKNEVRTHAATILSLKREMGHLQVDKDILVNESEKKTKEAEKQRSILAHLEHKCAGYNSLKIMFQEKEEEHVKTTKLTQNCVFDLMKQINELEKRTKHQITKTMSVQSERSLISQNLFKALEQIKEQTKIIEELREETKNKTSEINSLLRQQSHLAKQHKYLWRRHDKVKQLLANEKVAHKIARDCAEKDKNMAQSQLAKSEAEKERLENDLEYYEKFTIDQTGLINRLEHIKATQEQKIKVYEKEIEILNNQIRDTSNELYRIPRAPRIRNTTMEKIRRVYPSVQIKQQHLKDLLQVKDKEIEKLKSMLARRPEDAIQKLQKCQWDIRQLKKEAMSQEALLVMYKTKVKNQEEVNSSMSVELRQLRITCKQESRNRTLPPLSKKPQPPPLDKPSDRPRSSCATGFPQRPVYYQSRRPSLNSVRLPPLQLNK